MLFDCNNKAVSFLVVTETENPVSDYAYGVYLEAEAGFEPANNGFANHRLRPLGHSAVALHSKGRSL